MGNLVLTRKPGESIDIYDPNNAAMGVIVITQGTIRGKHSSIAIDAPRNLMIKRSELVGKEADILSENKYYSLGPDPIAAIAALGFTRELTGFALGGYGHESLPMHVRNLSSQEGWVCVSDDFTVNVKCSVDSLESLDSLKDCVLRVALEELRKQAAK